MVYDVAIVGGGPAGLAARSRSASPTARSRRAACSSAPECSTSFATSMASVRCEEPRSNRSLAVDLAVAGALP